MVHLVVDPGDGWVAVGAAGSVVECDPVVAFSAKQDNRVWESPFLDQVWRVEQRETAVDAAGWSDSEEWSKGT